MAARPLNIVQVLPALGAGGVERGTLEVAGALAERGHRSIVISEGGILRTRLTGSGSEHLAWPIGRKSLFTLRLVPRLRRFLADNHIDILHARSRFPAWVAYFAWRGMDPRTRPRFVTTAHGFYRVGRYSEVMARGERVIAVSEAIRNYLLRHYPRLPAERIQVIHRGIDETQFPFGYRPSEGWMDKWYRQYPHLLDAFVLTLPGRLSRIKGHHAFLDLMDTLDREGIPVQGLIVGGEEPRHRRYAHHLRERVRERRAANVTFTAHRGDLREICAVSDVVLSLSSQPESFGRTVLEALSIGTPVFGYAHGGVDELLKALYPEGAIPPGDTHSLLDKVTRAVRERPGPVRADHPFTLNRMLDATLALYGSLTNGVARD